ncbi:MAG TPA: VOC family protein [Myxococcales bacterium]|jgi:catechol 2,3-dioxygenase-like lactoylglutathione lyase family enzyme|nr:VOC family protein [Myxococcales bacterium]
MVEHFSLVCKSSKKSRKFYEAALKPLGYKCDMEYGNSFGFADADGRHDFWVVKGKTKTPTHFAFLAKDKKQIDAFHAAAVKAGGEDNGKPGPREEYAGYAAFVLDLDGNNVEAVIWEGAPPKSEKPAKKPKKKK